MYLHHIRSRASHLRGQGGGSSSCGRMAQEILICISDKCIFDNEILCHFGLLAGGCFWWQCLGMQPRLVDYIALLSPWPLQIHLAHEALGAMFSMGYIGSALQAQERPMDIECLLRFLGTQQGLHVFSPLCELATITLFLEAFPSEMRLHMAPALLASILHPVFPAKKRSTSEERQRKKEMQENVQERRRRR